MIVRNWMQRDPISVHSDTLVSEAQGIISEKELRILPVVDDGVLRGVLTRKNLNESANCVTRTQSIHEVDYFVNHLLVKDVMNRMVKFVDVNDTVEYCMLKGHREGISTFPVMDGDKLVGIVSEVEIFRALLQILGAEEKWQGLTLEPMEMEKGILRKVATLSAENGARNHAIFTMRMPDSPKKKIIIRFETDDLDRVVKAFKEAGYTLLEVISEVQACRLNHDNHINCPA